MRYLLLASLVFAGLTSFSTEATAQGVLRPGIQVTNQPAFSPYLNLLQPSGSTALNYYGLVRPQLEFRNNIAGLDNAVDINRQSILNGQNTNTNQTSTLTTGHAAVFLNTGGYFLNSNRLGGAQGGRGQGNGRQTGGTAGTNAQQNRPGFR
jgi:hypothetical protein